MKRIHYISFLLLMGFLSICSCGSVDSSGNGDEQIQDYILNNSINYQQSSSGLFYNITSEGTSPLTSETSFVVFDLRGQLLDGTSVGNTFGSDADVRIDLNQNIIPGLKEALLFLGKGGRGTFILPSELAFGAGGNGIVPGNAPILYELEILGIYGDDIIFSDEVLSQYIADMGIEDVFKTESGLYILIEEPGNETTPSSSDRVTIHYEGYLLNGDIFDSSIARGAPATLLLNQVIPGWTEGIPYFGEEGKGKLLIPSHLAYGAAGSQTIAAYTPLIFDIELLSVN